MISRSEAEQLDRHDPLATMRDRFVLPPDVIYLDGNSLGPLPHGVQERLASVVVEEWGEGLIRSWNTAGWMDLPTRVGDKIGALIGAEPGTTVCCDSTSVNAFKVLSGALDIARAPVILTDSGNFPTDIYVMSELCRRSGAELRIVEPGSVLSAVDDSVGVVALTQVDYRTGRRHNLAEVCARAQRVGAITVWDLAHSAGAFKVDLAGARADFAIGCGYKYLNGGPGAPAFVYIAPDRQVGFSNPMSGWFGHARPFDFDLEFRPIEGAERARVGTSHVLSLSALDTALDVFSDVDMGAVELKSASLTGLFIEAVEQLGGFEIVTSRDPVERGSQVSLRHPNAYPIVQALIDRGVIGDFRAPEIARFGFAPLFVRHVDVLEAAAVLGDVMSKGLWEDHSYSVRNAVT